MIFVIIIPIIVFFITCVYFFIDGEFGFGALSGIMMWFVSVLLVMLFIIIITPIRLFFDKFIQIYEDYPTHSKVIQQKNNICSEPEQYRSPPRKLGKVQFRKHHTVKKEHSSHESAVKHQKL